MMYVCVCTCVHRVCVCVCACMCGLVYFLAKIYFLNKGFSEALIFCFILFCSLFQRDFVCVCVCVCVCMRAHACV